MIKGYDKLKTSGTPEQWMEEYAITSEMLLGFRIFYSATGDSAVYYDSPPMDVNELPKENVQLVVVHHFKDGRNRKVLLDGSDEYHLPGLEIPLLGKEIPWMKFQKITDIAVGSEW